MPCHQKNIIIITIIIIITSMVGLTDCTRISTHLSIIASMLHLSTAPPRHLKWLRDLQWGNMCLPPANVPRFSTVGQTCATYQPHVNICIYLHMYVFPIAAGDVESLFVCLHRLMLASAGIFDPRSAQVELFSEPLCSILQVSGSFALC